MAPLTDIDRLYPAHVECQLERAAAALESAGCDALVVFAGREHLRPRDDVAWPFRPDPWFAAFVPLLEHPGSALRIVPGRRPRLVLHAPADFWHAPPTAAPPAVADVFEVVHSGSDEETAAALGRFGPHSCVLGDAGGIDTGQARTDDTRLLAALDYQRAFKTAYEIACMRVANRIAARGHAGVAALAGPGVSERDLDSRYLAASEQRESSLPYPSIIALNAHASVLHYQRLDRAPPDRFHSLLIDAGATYRGYAADVTRTQGDDAEFADLIDAVDELQQTISRRAVAGVDFVDLDRAAHEALGRVLAEHGLIHCSADAAFDSGLTRLFLPHGLGHLIGLQVHDAGGYRIAPDGELRRPPPEAPFLRLTRRLAPGFAVTIEPGLYFIETLLRNAPPRLRQQIAWPQIERLLPFGGIRVEDDIVVGAADSENLTRAALAAVEKS